MEVESISQGWKPRLLPLQYSRKWKWQDSHLRTASRGAFETPAFDCFAYTSFHLSPPIRTTNKASTAPDDTFSPETENGKPPIRTGKNCIWSAAHYRVLPISQVMLAGLGPASSLRSLVLNQAPAPLGTQHRMYPSEIESEAPPTGLGSKPSAIAILPRIQKISGSGGI